MTGITLALEFIVMDEDSGSTVSAGQYGTLQGGTQQYHPLPPTTHVPGREGRRQPRASVTGHSLLPSGEMLLREGEVGTSAIHHQERAGYI